MAEQDTWPRPDGRATRARRRPSGQLGDGTYRPIALALAQAALTVGDVETADALASAAVDWSRPAGTPVLGRALVLAAATRGRDVGEAVVIADRTGAT